jgi:predicted aldo/keto reductase-like oxidoreductase
MEKVLGAAAEDGRFDLMLLVYNFMNQEEGEKVLATCKEKNIGTTIMKASPGRLEIDPFDPENPNEEYAGYIDRMTKRGLSREEAVLRIQNWLKEEEEALEKTKPFVGKYGIKAEEELKQRSIQWVLKHPDVHTVCISMPDFDHLDRFLPLSGTKLSFNDETFLGDYRRAFESRYCRHACSECVGHCPHRLSVSAIMRYSYYYACQGRQKYAMGRYARLQGQDGSLCLTCEAPCRGACPHGVPIQANLVKAHSLLTFT